MFEWLVEIFRDHPYPAVAIVFLLCGIGLPLPEELVLITAGFVCHTGVADLEWMIATCILAILVGDMLPFYLGRTFGARLLRIRWMRIMINPRRLDAFDRWFRKRGDLVIFIARFIAGIRVVAYFIAGTMKMTWRRFLLLDLLGILITAPTLVYVGYVSGNLIQDVIAKVQTAERGILIAVGSGLAVFGLWWWLRRRRLRRAQDAADSGVPDTFIGPSLPESTDGDGASAEPPTEAFGDVRAEPLWEGPPTPPPTPPTLPAPPRTDPSQRRADDTSD
jgi:membrane protein DedA with SNARE-associated domain